MLSRFALVESRRANPPPARVVLPYLIPSTARWAARPRRAERVTLGHIGVGGRGRDLFRRLPALQGRAERGRGRWLQGPPRGVAKDCKGKAYADFRELLARPNIDAVVVATPDHWHVPIAIAAARAKKDAYVEKPLGVSVEQRPRLPQGLSRRTSASSSTARSSGALHHCRFGCELVRSGQIGKVHAIEVIAPNGGGRRIDQGDARPARPRLRHVARPRAEGPTRPTAAIRRARTGSTTTRSATWAAGAPIRWTSWSGAATPTSAGRMTVEGTGVIPTKGLYDTVYNWDMKIQFADGVKMTFKPGGDSTKFIGPDGWVQISRGGIDADPKSLLQLEDRPERRASDRQPAPRPELHRRGPKSRQAPVSPLDDAVRSDIISQLCDIAVRTEAGRSRGTRRRDDRRRR